jgi:hypothetical protein
LSVYPLVQGWYDVPKKIDNLSKIIEVADKPLRLSLPPVFPCGVARKPGAAHAMGVRDNHAAPNFRTAKHKDTLDALVYLILGLVGEGNRPQGGTSCHCRASHW